eukprot:gnl/Hemi2/23900_TR8024_c0_g1_i1.p2 gnl/Hemi2/23900_TR8024_c0_g1~~gnl/Hemi2/23900_TR8024_c0_g1_i1.p2  ORF type:complete len:190 (+),score=45.53 gnl/Hemi2/23900_TR8024_c0_g1_i1:74-643(+)
MLASFDKRCSAQFVRALQCHSTRGAPHHAKCEVEDLRFFLCAASELCTAAKSGSKGDLRGCLQVHAGDHVQCRSQFVEVHRSCLAKHFQSRPRIIEILSKLHADGGDLDDSTQKARTTIQVGEEVCPLMHDALQKCVASGRECSAEGNRLHACVTTALRRFTQGYYLANIANAQNRLLTVPAATDVPCP